MDAGEETKAALQAVPAVPARPRAAGAGLIVATIVVAQASWLAALGFLAYKLVA